MSLSPITEIIADMKAGRLAVLVDEEDRENEGDLIFAADFVTPEKVIADLGARTCSLEEGFEQADGVVIMNNHPGYLSAGIPELTRRLRAPALFFESWGLFSPEQLSGPAGFRYGTLGAPFRDA